MIYLFWLNIAKKLQFCVDKGLYSWHTMPTYMRYSLKKSLVQFLRLFIYCKRFLFWIGRVTGRFFGRLDVRFRETLGFYIYKLFFHTRKVGGRLVSEHKLVDFFGKRAVLQVILFAVGLLIMLPHSVVSSKQAGNAPSGRDTILYHLVGPGDQEFSLQELQIETSIQPAIHAPNWREGAVSSEGIHTTDGRVAYGAQDISSVSVGGSAVTKPAILPNTALPDAETGTTIGTRRDKIVVHSVAPGETVSGIAALYGISEVTVLWANNLTANSLLKVGQPLNILPVSGVVHSVANGDSVARIARLYDAKTEDIITQNKLQNDGGDIRIGEQLVIPGGVRPAPVATAPVRVTKPTVSRPTVTTPVSKPAPSSQSNNSGWIWPTDATIITQYFGLRHNGLDIAGKSGINNYAANSGTVVTSQCGYNGGYGCYVIIDHGGGVRSLYGHNSKLLVSVGEKVSKGQVVGILGSTGRSTGPHIHFEIIVNGRRVNPLTYIR